MTALNKNSNQLPRVLVVNDDHTQLNVLCGLLHKAGLQPLPFRSAESALTAMRLEAAPALIITDIYMPGIDGWRFCRLLRSPENEQFNRVPILVVSATFSGDDPARITADLGANAFLSMPVDGQYFIEQVQVLLRGEKPQAVTRMIIVEDSKLTSTRLLKAFQARGYLVEAAFSVQEALDLIAQTAYDIALLDYHLPDGLGDVLLKHLQEKFPECVCMMMTVDPRPELALTWMKMGAAAYLPKPFEPEYIVAVCERARRERALLRSQDLLELRTRQLQASEARFRNAMSATSDGLWDWDILTGKVYYSPAYLDMLGYGPGDLPAVLDTWLDLVHPDDREAALAANQACLKNITEKVDAEFRMRAKDGSWRWIRGRGKALQRGADGQALQMIGTHQDITERKQAEQILRESEERYRMVVSNTPVVTFVTDEKGIFTLSEGKGLARLGLQPGQVVGLSVFDVYRDYPDVIEVMNRALAGHNQRNENSLDGIVYDTFYSPVFDEHGKVQKVIGVAYDITERKHTEDALYREEQLLKKMVSFVEELLKTGSEQVTYPKILENLLVISKAKFGVLNLFNESSGKFTTVAIAGLGGKVKNIASLLGFEPIGKEWNDYSVNNEKLNGKVLARFSSMSELAGRVLPQAITGPLEKLLNIGEITVTKVIVNDQIIGDFTLIMPAGRQLENDFLVEIYSRQIDMFITRIKAEKELKESEQKYRTVANFTYAWEAWRDPDGAYLYISPACEGITGHAMAEFLADPQLTSRITHPDDRAKLNEHYHAAHHESRALNLQFDFRIITSAGETRWLSHLCTPIFSEAGQWLGRRESNIDITERKQAEQALRDAHNLLEQRVVERTAELQAANLDLEKAARLKDEFLASMSHELRTPLTGILGLSEVLQMPHIGPLNQKQSTYIGHIYDSGQHLLELINDILDLSKLDAGKFELNRAPCSLKEICQSSLQITAAQAAAKHLQASFSMIPDSIELNADGRRLKQIVVNLLSNAIKFTHDGGSFGIRVLGSPHPRLGTVTITVWDTGIGIKEEDIPRLFQSFIQLDARLSRQYPGTGLGLALVRKLAELHGGQVSVQSAAGQGSSFTVSLPWQGR